MNKVGEYLKNVGTFYLATVEGNQPRVRPFGAVAEYNGKTYLCTNNTKNCFKQMQINPKIEISACNTDGSWIRISGEVAVDSSDDAREAMLEANPGLRNLYSIGDGVFEVLYFTKATAAIYSFKAEPEVFSF
ncbi:MAG: pyridoxamine 5'-phosphate oxidase family protein [Mobilitalea sp.]